MIISKKKFNEEVKKAVEEALLQERRKNNERLRSHNEANNRRRSEDCIWDEINKMRNQTLDIARELNGVVTHLCETDENFAKKKLKEVSKQKNPTYACLPPRFIGYGDCDDCGSEG